MAAKKQPIGIFDSGVGGLTVVKAILERLPEENIVYFGDTARIPYGTKSSRTIGRFARQDCEFLRRFDPKLVVVACNSASAAAMPTLQHEAEVPCVGVIRPGARRAVEVAKGRPIGIIATEATIASRSYHEAILAIDPQSRLLERACPLLVPMVEEGRDSHDPLVRSVLKEYLAEMKIASPGVLVLGCTHYPLLREAISCTFDGEITLVDSAMETAKEVAAVLAELELATNVHSPGEQRYFVSDNPQRFAATGQRFLGRRLAEVELVSPDTFFQTETVETSLR